VASHFPPLAASSLPALAAVLKPVIKTAISRAHTGRGMRLP
jgi:hypothetical protein